MENKVNRILQDKINLLSKQELDALAQSYIGKNAFILFDNDFNTGKSDLFNVSKVRGYEPITSWFPNGLEEDDEDRDRKKGDKAILFILENGQMWELVDFAVIGDTINVKDRKGNGYSNYEIVDLNTTLLGIDNKIGDSRVFSLPISRKIMILPMLMDIGWLSKNALPQMNMQQNVSVPAFTGNSSKVLNYLQVPQQLSDNFPEDIKEFVAIIEGSQEIYSESVDSNQKEQLAELIVGWMRQLMEFLQTQKLGIYGNMNVKLEQQTLPNQNTPKVKLPTPKSSSPKPTPSSPKPTPEQKTKPTPKPPTPSKNEDKAPFTKEELEDAIASAEIMAEIGDEDGIKDLSDLRSLYNRYYS